MRTETIIRHEPDGTQTKMVLAPAPVLWLDTAELESAAVALELRAAVKMHRCDGPTATAYRALAARMREICAAARKGELREVGPLLLRCVDVTVRAASEEPR